MFNMVENNPKLVNKKYKPDQSILDREKQYARDFMKEEPTVVLSPVCLNHISVQNPDWFCKLCDGILLNAFECSNCFKPFCLKCIEKHIKFKQTCPKCN